MSKIVDEIIEHLLKQDNKLENKRNLISYVIHSEEQHYGTIIWKSCTMFRKILEKSSKIITKEEYNDMIKRRGIYADLITQFAMDHSYVLE